MNSLLKGAVASGFLLGLAGVAQANLIVNGSFEENALARGSWSVFNAIDGWSTVSGPGIEIQNNVTGPAYDGVQFVELDSHANSAMAQTIGTAAGQTYLLEFAYSPRPGVDSYSNLIDVFWNGISLTDNAGITANGAATTLWSLLNFNVVGTGNDTLTFAALGKSDAVGGFVDGVSLTAAASTPAPVPEPAALLLFGTGLVGLSSWMRRMRG
ncbi:PEP-CTERM sorting domain-containing protein [Desulfobulbus sp.]|uniref:PEP-CTERM sorting domain-containing protein n=1 Tax=Desulfobulbus sp. TaxID=895 RepID=UPI00286F38A5|nr:PEP-CTERM sorting domain-containing protein [Desulfobulbus sp.]